MCFCHEIFIDKIIVYVFMYCAYVVHVYCIYHNSMCRLHVFSTLSFMYMHFHVPILPLCAYGLGRLGAP